MRTVVILGSAHPFRGGGITTFNERLAREFQQQGFETLIYSFSLQYPTFLFPGKTQYSEEAAPPDLRILSKVNSINPINWLRVGKQLQQLAPDLIVVRYWLPFMGAAFGTILRMVKRNRHTRIIAITDNVIPHEKRPGDTALTRYFLKSCDGFVTMSEKVFNDLQQFVTGRPIVQVLHPLYDSFGAPISKEEARRHLGIDHAEKLLLFFGFIRKYKGLDLLLEAFSILLNRQGFSNARLVVAGEFYDDERTYQLLIDKLGIRDNLVMKTGFIPEKDVRDYFCASDVVIQPYRSATQSGVTPLAYHFEKPMIVTNVGGLPSYVPHEKAGLVTAPDPESIAEAIMRYFELGEQHFIPHLRKEKLKYSWDHFVKSIVELEKSLS